MIVPRRPDSLSPFRLMRLDPAGIHPGEVVPTGEPWLRRLPMLSRFAERLATRNVSLAARLVRRAGDCNAPRAVDSTFVLVQA